MASLTQCGIDLFGGTLPSLDDIKKLCTIVNSSERNKLEFAKTVEENASNNLAAGIGLCMLGKYSDAVDKLFSANECSEKYLFIACAQRKLGRFDDSLGSYEGAAKCGADSLKVNLGKAETLRCAGRLEEASETLKACTNFANVSAEYHFCLGKLCDSQGEYAAAMDNYATAIELDPEHQKALFQLAYSCDLRGDDEAAIDYYQQIKKNHPVYVNAMLNLAILCDDAGKFNKALKYVDMVLQSHPNHKKALLFKKDIESSTSMVYDEEKEKLKTRHNQILEIPISDFELSVRSRNCLKKMNINTIGDLLNISEAELLSYKNFGETSLTEIKYILDSKGLRLGMALEEGSTVAPEVEINEENHELLNMSCQDMELSVRARRCLQRLGCKNIAELISKTEAELLGCKNFGVTSLNEIKDRLKSYGLGLRKLE